MSRTMLRLVQPSPSTGPCTGDVYSIPHPGGRQLSLFDLRPSHRVLCLPMADIHGVTFSRALTMSRYRLVLDARAYPYFDLPGLNRPMASRLLDGLECAYVQAPLDLRPPQDQAARWQRRQAVRAVLADKVGNTPVHDGSAFVVLVNGLTEIDVLDEALRGLAGDEEHVWQVQPHEAVSSVPGNPLSR